jgi:hypothetical protein
MTLEGVDEAPSGGGRWSRMDARWIPVLAAVVGVLGGVGGALIGGYVANQGQQQRFKSERAAAIQDLRIETYGALLGTGQEVTIVFEPGVPDAEKREALVRLFAAEARVALVAETPAVADAARAVREALTAPASTPIQKQIDDYVQAANKFLSVARQEIAETQD